MVNKTEHYNKNRRRTLIGFTVSFAIWWGTITLTSIFPSIKEIAWLYLSLTVIGIAGWIYWTIQLLKIERVKKDMKKDPELCVALNDEFYQHLRLKSFTYAFFVMTLLQAILLLINTFATMTAESILKINLLVVVLAPLITFILLENDQSYEESQA